LQLKQKQILIEVSKMSEHSEISPEREKVREKKNTERDGAKYGWEEVRRNHPA